MPELPEVETIRRDLASVLIGKQILMVETNERKLLKPSFDRFKELVLNQKVTHVDRRAKVVQIGLTNKTTIMIHLKLTGRLLYRESALPRDTWQHVTLTLSDGQELRFCDLRKFGWLKAVPTNEVEKELGLLGPEPGRDLTLTHFRKVLGGTRRAVKIVLMDQSKIAGVGNIYANDALLLAKIDPRRAANNLNEVESGRLFKMIEKVIRAGLRYRGASDNHYLDAFGRKGHYQDHFVAYGKTGQPCPQCGSKIERVVVGGRGTFICPKCQK